MEIVLLEIVAFLRPMFFIELGHANLFDSAAIGTFSVLVVVFLLNTALKKSIRFSLIDLGIVAFVLWCLAIYLIYFDLANLRGVAKIIIPPITYVIAKNVIRNEQEYQRMMLVMLLGFVFPILISAAMTMVGMGVETINFWTESPRYEGAYAGSHTFGHNMTFFLIATTVYTGVIKMGQVESTWRIGTIMKGVVVALTVLAVYCLVMSKVRTAMLGLGVFAFVYLLAFNRRLLFTGLTGAIVASILLWPFIRPFMFPDVVMVENGVGTVGMLASGRPEIWTGNASRFFALPLDMLIAGSGIGSNQTGTSEVGFMNSHNDYLDLLVQTGFVGLALFLAIQLVFLKAILKIPGRQRYLFLAAWLAITVMNGLSNSYVNRFGLGQLYFLFLTYVELPRGRDVMVMAGQGNGIPSRH